MVKRSLINEPNPGMSHITTKKKKQKKSSVSTTKLATERKTLAFSLAYLWTNKPQNHFTVSCCDKLRWHTWDMPRSQCTRWNNNKSTKLFITP